MEGAHHRSLDETVPADRLGGRVLVAVPLQIDVQSDAGHPAEQLQRLVERRKLGRHLAERVEGLLPHPPGSRAVADLEQVVRVREHERPVVQVEDVELDQVAAQLDAAPQGAQGVLGLERGGALVADPERAARQPASSRTPHDDDRAVVAEVAPDPAAALLERDRGELLGR